MNEILNMDCMEGMKEFPDKFFDLAIVDPPYGIGEDWKKRNKGRRHKQTSYDNKQIPTAEYFKELKRVSKEYVIWGWNYYTAELGATNYLICWDKVCGDNHVIHYSQFELACTSLHRPCKMLRLPWDGYRMGEETGVEKIHPHQKPIALYKWILKNYAKPGDKILDTHVGSGSSICAIEELKDELNLSYMGYEIDSDYHFGAVKRVSEYRAKLAQRLPVITHDFKQLQL